MHSNEIRATFLDFFQKKGHKIVPSAPMVIKNDPTLMFTNAGMNQFKDIFLGISPIADSRITDSQKCLRVSGKHNDLEEVGHDTYHHTMFEMLGNWSFGDYFKKEAIDWAWELLTEVFQINSERLYATVYEGDLEDKIDADNEAREFWLNHLPAERIIYGNKKDNFWEMGATGPCGPCSEIHIDLRTHEERERVVGSELINKDDPLVIEIWNLVFMQYNRKEDATLHSLPHKHVDTGMGFERLAMLVQGKTSNYDTDIFQPIIQRAAALANVEYGVNNKIDIALRVIADHVRTIAFSIADDQLPSNTGAGYVIRRILRRAVRYAYTFLNQNQPFLHKLTQDLLAVMGAAYPELQRQKTIIEKVIFEEEQSFLRTLDRGIALLDQLIASTKKAGYSIISGADAFKLYDTYGFPLDLTELILREHGLILNKQEFDEEMSKQKNAGRVAAAINSGDWTILREDDIEEFIGYDTTETELFITKYRKVSQKGNDLYHIVFNITPFYGESGGQVGDRGYIEANDEKISIIDTLVENKLIIHIVKTLPKDPMAHFKAVVSKNKRLATAANHSATHLLHNALREVLGSHVEQKGSLVDNSRLRFDFSHFQKLTEEELRTVEHLVNQEIRKNTTLQEFRSIPLKEAEEKGAIALFGEKYGDLVRVIQFGDSIELCGGTHVKATGDISFFKIISESAIAAGIRRIEAVTGETAEQLIFNEIDTLNKIRGIFVNQKDLSAAVKKLYDENKELKKTVEKLEQRGTLEVKQELLKKAQTINGISLLTSKLSGISAAAVKDLAFQLREELKPCAIVLGSEHQEKPSITIMFSEDLLEKYDLNAGKLVKEAAKAIKGGGGGQKFLATAGGKSLEGIEEAIQIAETQIRELL